MSIKVKVKKVINKRKLAIIISIPVVIIGIILYLLADRYLIEHVEIKVEKPTAISTISEVSIVSDDWNYSSSSKTITVKKVQTGSGNNTITSYVADVVLKNTDSFFTAFAKDSFGTNIIENTSTIAENNDAILAINGEYYGFREDGVVIKNGILFRDEPTRDALALYKNGIMEAYDETKISSSELISDDILNTFSFGPVLIHDGVKNTEYKDTKIDKNIGNWTIEESNPRTGIGMISANHFVFVVVDGRQENYSKGMTLNQFADFFEELGCVEAYNLDGGGSSTMYFNGRVVNSPSKGEERATSDIIFIK